MTFKEQSAAFHYINAYQKKNYERITILVKRGTKEKYLNMAKDRGMSTSEFFVYCAKKVEEWEEKKEKKD